MDKLIETFAKAAKSLAVFVAIIALVIGVIKADAIKTAFSNFITNSFTEMSQEAGIGGE